MSRCIWAMIVPILIPALAAAEIILPPDNVVDPSKPSAMRSSDPSLPYIYLEPHDFCYDAGKAMPATIHVVNRSPKEMRINWPEIVESLHIEAIGPGKATPLRGRTEIKVDELGPSKTATLTVDLSRLFRFEGVSVYQLSFSRPLDDGRIHVGQSARFVVENDLAVDRLALGMEIGVARDTALALLKNNSLFAAGGGPRDDDWEDLGKGSDAARREDHWTKSLTAAREQWLAGIGKLTAKKAPAGQLRALEAIVDRILTLSDGFRAEPDQQFFLRLDERLTNDMDPAERERVYLKLVKARSPYVVSRAMNRLMGSRSKDALDDFFRIAEGPYKELALEAMSCLSDYPPNNTRIIQFLRRKMTDADPVMALEAAIISCYSGDDSGIPIVLRCATSSNAEVRLKAIAQLVDRRVGRNKAKVVPILLGELKKPMNDETLERAIESLSSYPSAEILESVQPFTTHKNPLVSARARMSFQSIQHELGK